MGEDRKYSHNGARRKKKKIVSPAGTGTQTLSIDLRSADLFQITTDACTATAMTIDVTGLYDGAEFRVYYNSLHCCDALVFTFDGAAEKNYTDASTGRKVALTVADQNLVKGYVLDTT
ncbi:MAG TPA: hypothetical protein VMV86_07125, partial [Methanosarcinales archaeon]|nr:hypothetical protein [Methanosarcinales archaeon]